MTLEVNNATRERLTAPAVRTILSRLGLNQNRLSRPEVWTSGEEKQG